MFGELSMLIFETQDANKYLSFDFVIFSKCFNGNLEVEIYNDWRQFPELYACTVLIKQKIIIFTINACHNPFIKAFPQIFFNLKC